MSAEPRLVLAVALATVGAYVLTPLAIAAAGRLDFYDKPKGYKGHGTPIPYLGGGAVLAAFVIVLALVAGDFDRTLPLLGGVGVLWIVGTIDDRRNLSPLLRVLVEVLLAGMLWATGLGWDLDAGGAVELAATVLWVLAVVNAFNLFDNMDGASSAMAAVVSAAVAVLGLSQNDPWLVAAGAALAGSCLGFLPYNLARPQARIFLGDGGSMPIGFAIAALVMTGASEAADGWLALAVGLLLVGLPATDTALVIVSRRRKGISVLTGGRDHLTHRARRRLGTARAVAFTLGAVQALVASVALVALGLGPSALIAATVVGITATGAVITLLEREEDRLHETGELVVPVEALDKARAKREQRESPTVGDAALILLGLGAGLSPFGLGYYDAEWWVPIGLGVVIVAAIGAIRRPQHLPIQAWAALVGLTGIGLLALLSARWSASAYQAIVGGNRWLVLAMTFGLALVLVRNRRRDLLAVATLGLGTVAVAGFVVITMLGSDPASVFLGGRLHLPLGYINAEATVFLMGVWLALVAAERSRPAWLAGLGLSAATAMAALSLLSQSRGAALTGIASVVIVMVVVPGRTRRAFAIAMIATALAAVSGPILGVYEAAQGANGIPPDASLHRAATAILVASAITGLVWGVMVAVIERTSGPMRATLDRGGRVAVGLGATALIVVAFVFAGDASDRVSAQWQAFTAVGDPATAPVGAGDSRLVSGSGNRYEYWSVAWDAFRDEPLRGVGAGNFDRAWFRDRTVAEDVRQPHSIELQVLSELGLAGGALLLLFVGAFATAALRVHRFAERGTAKANVAVAAVGVPAVWLVHTSVDWQHLIPGTTAVALTMLAVLLRQPQRSANTQPAAVTDRRRLQPWLAAGGIGLVVAIAGATLTRQVFADQSRASAFAAIRTDPRSAVRHADRSLRLDPDAPRTAYAKAAALARLGRGDEAVAALRRSLRSDPTNPVTWALLGDLATRQGLLNEAAAFYDRALALNPRDPGLQVLAGAPGATAPDPR